MDEGTGDGARIAAAIAIAALIVSLIIIPSARAQSGESAMQALSAFNRDYGAFMSTQNIAVSYSANLDYGYYGTLLSIFSPTITMYKFGSDFSTRITLGSVFLPFYSISATFYESNGTTLYCLGSSTWFATSVARCGLVGNISAEGITTYYPNFDSSDFSNVSYEGTSASGSERCDAFSGAYSGNLLNGLLSKVGLHSGTTATFRFCLNSALGYLQQLNASLQGYSLGIKATGATVGGARQSDFALPVNFVADWPACHGNSVSFYYVPVKKAVDPHLTITPKGSQALLSEGTLNGSFRPFGMYRLNITASGPVNSGENLSVCIGGQGDTCAIMQCT